MISLEKACEIFEILKEEYDGIGSALNFETPFQLLIATILSAQTTDAQVNRMTPRLFADYPDPEAMAALSSDELEEYIKGCGLYRNKAKNIIATVSIVLNDYSGEVPRDRVSLMSLPGVGRKTANVILSNAFGLPALAVDTHVMRTSNRLGLADSKNPTDVETQVCSLLPKEQWGEAHHWLIWHGRRICKAQKPLCEQCYLNSLCLFYSQDSESAPSC